MNSPTCPKCDCVKGCQSNPSPCPILLAECIASGQVSAYQIEQHRVLDAPIAQPAMPDCWVVVKDGRILGTHDEPGHIDGLQAVRYVPAGIAQPEQTAPPESALKSLSRRCLWIAYCWNDHNFNEASTYAKKTAQELGINDFDDANKWLEAQPEQPANSNVLPTDAITVNLMRLAGLDKHKARKCEAIVRQMLVKEA